MSKIKKTIHIDVDDQYRLGFFDEIICHYDLVNQQCADIVVSNNQHGLCLHWNTGQGKPLLLQIDVAKPFQHLRSFPAAKQGAFNQALGKQNKHVIDATAGWAGDSLLMCSQGYQVTMLEREPLMAMLLQEAMNRLSQTVWAKNHHIIVPVVMLGDAAALLKSNDKTINADCVYLDPMFPPKRKKSAATNKNMQFLQWLLDHDADADASLATALSAGYQRVVVKRPDYAQPLLEQQVQPSTRFSSKLVHYDVYLNH